MVRNKTGGSGHKKRASKNENTPITRHLRVPKEDGEILGKITRLFGNSMAEVLCDDNVTRLLIIRKRFKGRNKRDNNIEVNKLALVGRRLWEVVHPKKKQKVDLLYVYSQNQIAELLQRVKISPYIIPPGMEVVEELPGFDTTSKHDWKKDAPVIGGKKDENKEPDFDFDDI